MRAKIVYVALALALVMGLAIAVSVVSAQGPVDYVDIGNTTSEAGHNLQGWGPIEPATSGGHYGGVDDCRCTVNPSECSNPDLLWGSLTLDTGTGMTATELKLGVLDGTGNDSFKVYVNDNPVYTYIWSGDTSENWVVHTIDISEKQLSGSITVKVDSTASAWSGCSTYGQLAVDWAELYAETSPEEEGGGGCFIATAAYGTSSSAEIDTLRAFRDEVLLQNSLGSQLVTLYYEVSPPVADFISGHEPLRTLVRELVIEPMVSLAKLTQGIWGD